MRLVDEINTILEYKDDSGFYIRCAYDYNSDENLIYVSPVLLHKNMHPEDKRIIEHDKQLWMEFPYTSMDSSIEIINDNRTGNDVVTDDFISKLWDIIHTELKSRVNIFGTYWIDSFKSSGFIDAYNTLYKLNKLNI